MEDLDEEEMALTLETSDASVLLSSLIKKEEEPNKV